MSVQKCTRCGAAKHKGRCKAANLAGGQKTPAPVDAGLETGPALSIAPGLGLQAWIENGCLQLAQGEDIVALSQTEAKVLFAQFDEWVRA